MKKIWVINGQVYKSETYFLKEIRRRGTRSDIEYQIFELSESGLVSDWKIKTEQEKIKNDRDLQLRTIFNDLSTTESNIFNFIKLYEKYYVSIDESTDVLNPSLDYIKKQKIRYNKTIKNLIEENKFDIKSFSKIIIDHKKHFIYHSDELDWHIALLKCHNFQNYYTTYLRYKTVDGKRVSYYDEIIPEKTLESFMSAKLTISREKKERKK